VTLLLERVEISEKSVQELKEELDRVTQELEEAKATSAAGEEKAQLLEAAQLVHLKVSPFPFPPLPPSPFPLPPSPFPLPLIPTQTAPGRVKRA
jgi:hypothetical protein